MTPHFLHSIAIIFYLITWVLLIKSVRHDMQTDDTQKTNNTQGSLTVFTWVTALLAHILSIVNPFTGENGIAFDFFTLCSYVMWFISLILFIFTIRRKIQALGVLILPFTVLSLLLLFGSASPADTNLAPNNGLGLHILSSLLAYSVLMLATVQAILLAFQNNYLHSLHQHTNKANTNKFFRTLPALEDMEHFLFSLIGIGVLLLSVGLITGFYYLDNLFGSHVAHKTILSLISWVVYSALLFGRWKNGWRGKTAVRWTLIGFSILALAFFGSKFIQEFVIKPEPSITTFLLERSSNRSYNNERMVKIGTPHLFEGFQRNTFLSVVIKESNCS